MIDYTQPAVAYLVRAAEADADGTLTEAGQQQVEAATQFLSYEKLGAVVASNGPGAIATAEAIFLASESTAGSVQVVEDLAGSLGAYLQAPQYAPTVIVWDSITKVPIYLPAVLPGGIISVHRDGGELKAVARKGFDIDARPKRREITGQ